MLIGLLGLVIAGFGLLGLVGMLLTDPQTAVTVIGALVLLCHRAWRADTRAG